MLSPTPLTQEMKTLITNHSAGMVATTRNDGRPAVSPKATFVILDDRTLAFGNLRSPGTLANLRQRPAVEVCFIDVVLRKAVRVAGSARIIPKANAEPTLISAFEALWAPYLPHMSAFVVIDVEAAEFILSPAYDLGLTEDALKATNLEKLNAL